MGATLELGNVVHILDGAVFDAPAISHSQEWWNLRQSAALAGNLLAVVEDVAQLAVLATEDDRLPMRRDGQADQERALAAPGAAAVVELVSVREPRFRLWAG